MQKKVSDLFFVPSHRSSRTSGLEDMTESIDFAKLSGSGNDFICIDNRHGSFEEILSSAERIGHFARTLCRRSLGIGADGVIFACEPQIEQVADIAARFFEADGSETELCGNGTACFIQWVTRNGWVPPREISVLTPAGVVRGGDGDPPSDPLPPPGTAITGNYVRVCIPSPENIETDLELMVDGSPLKCDFIVTGIPHVITYVDDICKVDVARLGPALRHHEHFGPRGANANFVQVLAEGKIALRTFEFGVEGETLACGTGSAAAAILSAMRFRLLRAEKKRPWGPFNWSAGYASGAEPVRVKVRSGDVLKIYFTLQKDGSIADVCLETVVRFIYSGKIQPELVAEALNSACGPAELAEARQAAGGSAP